MSLDKVLQELWEFKKFKETRTIQRAWNLENQKAERDEIRELSRNQMSEDIVNCVKEADLDLSLEKNHRKI